MIAAASFCFFCKRYSVEQDKVPKRYIMIDYSKEYHSCPLHGYRIKDERGCWQCLDELRQQDKLEAKENKPKKLYQIPPQSDKKRERERELRKLRKVKKAETPFCSSCGTTQQPLDYSHILSVKQYPQYELHPDNAVIQCRRCHETFEHGSLEEKMKLGNWQQMLNFILKYEPAYFNKLQLKSINKAA